MLFSVQISNTTMIVIRNRIQHSAQNSTKKYDGIHVSSLIDIHEEAVFWCIPVTVSNC